VLIEGAIEDRGAQSHDRRQTVRSPPHARAGGVGTHDRFPSGFRDPAAQVHPLNAKGRRAYPLHGGTNVFRFRLLNTPGFPWFGRERRQHLNRCDDLFQRVF
jgi:hypothetical protein